MAIDYNENVMSHFLEPKNVGVIEDADGIGQVGDTECGDVFVIFIKVNGSTLANVKYLIRGCGAAIATCSALSVIATGLPVDQATNLTDGDISRELGGLPLEKLHCSSFAATALHRAIEDYQQRQKAGLPPHRVRLRVQSTEGEGEK